MEGVGDWREEEEEGGRTLTISGVRNIMQPLPEVRQIATLAGASLFGRDTPPREPESIRAIRLAPPLHIHPYSIIGW